VKRNFLTTYEASLKYDLTPGYLRRLLQQKRVKGCLTKISKSQTLWIIESQSLKVFLENRPGPGRPKK